MTYQYNRRSIRLSDYDYSKAGYYFVTICTYGRFHLFGEIADNEMILNNAGKMLQHWHQKLEEKFPHIHTHEMVIMPNHIHFIIEIAGANPSIRPLTEMQKNIKSDAHLKGEHTGSPLRKHPNGTKEGDLGSIIQWFKTMTTNDYIKMVKEGKFPPFEKRIWQRNYHEHVIRNDVDYLRMAEYTLNNPLTWEDDIFAKQY